MKKMFKTLLLKTNKKLEISDITRDIVTIVNESNINNGLVNIWVPHTTAGLTVNEHDPYLWNDILSTMMNIVSPKLIITAMQSIGTYLENRMHTHIF